MPPRRLYGGEEPEERVEGKEHQGRRMLTTVALDKKKYIYMKQRS